MPRKLKVFRTPTGFHDAYVAAPSRKAEEPAEEKSSSSDVDALKREMEAMRRQLSELSQRNK